MQSLFTLIIASPEFLGTHFSDSGAVVLLMMSKTRSLIYSTTQATLVSHINCYLGLEKLGPDGLAVTSFQPGVLLAVLCILL